LIFLITHKTTTIVAAIAAIQVASALGIQPFGVPCHADEPVSQLGPGQ